jgi:hypothetical protein
MPRHFYHPRLDASSEAKTKESECKFSEVSKKKKKKKVSQEAIAVLTKLREGEKQGKYASRLACLLTVMNV